MHDPLEKLLNEGISIFNESIKEYNLWEIWSDEAAYFRNLYEVHSKNDVLISTPFYQITVRGDKVIMEMPVDGNVEDSHFLTSIQAVQKLRMTRPEKKKWGELSGTKRLLTERNEYIFQRFQHYQQNENNTNEFIYAQIRKDLEARGDYPLEVQSIRKILDKVKRIK
ncbi:hypothetical protein BVY01_02885 [bacterium I07]|nr:hypothetical protein BVY01_02885 [bacterium I07]